jgi:hypothetical protein
MVSTDEDCWDMGNFFPREILMESILRRSDEIISVGRSPSFGTFLEQQGNQDR